MDEWLTAAADLDAQGRPFVLVTVIGLRGSGPREVGAAMLVAADGSHGSIGGGRLEFAATAKARHMLAHGRADLLRERFALGPELGQCCGGAVELLFEPWSGALAWSRPRDGDAVLVTRLDGPTPAKYWHRAADPHDPVAALTRRIETPAGELLWQRREPRSELWLFGAGHVGRALVAALTALPFRIHWVDARTGVFPMAIPPNTRTLSPSRPWRCVADAAPGALFLVMTHEHGADLNICQSVLRRGDFGYLGLIGSRAKRLRFEKKWRQAGISPARIARVTSPIGVPGVRSKQPAIIAASVAAQLLQVAESRQRTGTNIQQAISA